MPHVCSDAPVRPGSTRHPLHAADAGGRKFIAAIADLGNQDGTVLLPPVLFQPESADDVAAT